MGDFNTALESGKVYINKVVKGTVKIEASVIWVLTPITVIVRSGLEESRYLRRPIDA